MTEKEILLIAKMKEAGKPLKSGEISDMAGLPKNEVDGLLKKMKNNGTIITPKRCYYSPSD